MNSILQMSNSGSDPYLLLFVPLQYITMQYCRNCLSDGGPSGCAVCIIITKNAHAHILPRAGHGRRHDIAELPQRARAAVGVGEMTEFVVHTSGHGYITHVYLCCLLL